MTFLFGYLSEELSAREYLNGQPNQLGVFPEGLSSESTVYGPCTCPVAPVVEKDDDFIA